MLLVLVQIPRWLQCFVCWVCRLQSHEVEDVVQKLWMIFSNCHNKGPSLCDPSQWFGFYLFSKVLLYRCNVSFDPLQVPSVAPTKLISAQHWIAANKRNHQPSQFHWASHGIGYTMSNCVVELFLLQNMQTWNCEGIQVWTHLKSVEPIEVNNLKLK